MNAEVAVVLVAAGSGSRLGLGAPKAFASLGGRTVLEVALEGVRALGEPVEIVVVAPATHLEAARALAGEATVVAGGDSRQRSVAAGLAALSRSPRIVLVHDAARCLTPAAVFDRVAAAVRAHGTGVVPTLPVVDTIKRVADGRVVETVPRDELAAAQTPQGFPREVLERALAAREGEATDDASLVAALGVPVRAVAGDELAFKITTPADLERAERAQGRARVGVGVDAHAFDETGVAPLWLGGLHWPGERGLAGHSDGDVVAHAIVDALLGAAGLGDIGTMFGTDDPAAAGAHADWFLPRALERVRAAGFRVENVSVEVVGNRPRLAPRRVELEAVLGALVEAPVSVAATTSDGLGLTGEGRGIGAIATALLAPA